MELKGGSGEKFILRGKVVEVEKTTMKREQSERMLGGGGEGNIAGIWKSDNSMYEMSQFPTSSSQIPCKSQGK